MIVDSLTHAPFYFGLNERLTAALRWLDEQDCPALPPGRIDIRGSQIFALVQDYDTKPEDQVRWEAHRTHYDVQYVAAGVERMGYANLQTLKVMQDYDAEKDYLLLEGAGDAMTIRAGSFAILAPQDAHRPGMSAGTIGKVRKIVIKVAV